MRTYKKFMSIRKKLIVVVGSLFIAYIIVLLLLNTLFLESYYIFSLEETFIEEAKFIKQYQDKPMNELLKIVRDRSGTTGYKYTMLDMKARVFLSSVPEFELGMDAEFPEHKQVYIEELIQELTVDEFKYVVLDHPQNDQSQIVMIMKFQEKIIVISSQLDEVVGHAKIANSFFLMTSLSLLIVILIATFVWSKRLVNPILILNKQVEDISNFNFDMKYQGVSRDELGQLGRNVNQISVELESRINELKNRNTLLKDDMVMQRSFLASIAHEFKSPVGIIKGYAESIKLNYYKTESEKNEFTEYIVEESDRLSHLVEDIIMLAKLDRRNFKLNLEKINLSELLHLILLKRQKSSYALGYKFLSNIEDNIIMNLDINRMEQILVNVVENALHYSNKKDDIRINLIQASETVILRVSNTCESISSEDMNQLSRPFFRVEESRSRSTGGHGLGLSIVKGLVEAQGGVLTMTCRDNVFNVMIEFSIN